MNGLQPGAKLFTMKAHKVQKDLRCALSVCGFKQEAPATWMAVRAGKAASLAAAGSSVQQVLAAGEWESKAFLRYVDEEKAEKLCQAAASSSSEDDASDEQHGIDGAALGGESLLQSG